MTVAQIKFEDVSISFPIFEGGARSIKTSLLNKITSRLTINKLSNVYEVNALKNLNFVLNEGDKVGLLGHNGAGKTSLLRTLQQVYYPKQGNIYITGNVNSLINISLGINPELTGRENIITRGMLQGLSKSFLTENMDEIINFSDLGEFIDLPVKTYSSGMHLRLAFSVATAVASDILLMDEWLSVGDLDFQHKAEERLNALINTSKIIVIASHSSDLIRKVCNRVILLDKGSIIMDGNPDDVLNYYYKI